MMDIDPYSLVLILLSLPERFSRRAVRMRSEIPAGLVIEALLEQGLITELDVGVYARVPAKMPRLMEWAPDAWFIPAGADDWRRSACIGLVSKTFVKGELDTASCVDECFGIIGVSHGERVLGCAMLASAGDIVSLLEGQIDTGDGWEHAHLDGSPLRCITTRLYRFDKNDGAPTPPWGKA